MTQSPAEEPASSALVMALDERVAFTPKPQERAFWVALALATMLHAGLFGFVSRSLTRVAGELSGVDDPIAASILTEEEFSQIAGIEQPPAAAAQLRQTLPPEAEVQKPTEPEEKSAKPAETPPDFKPDFKTETTVEPQTTPEATPEAKPETKPEQQTSTLEPLDLAADNPDILKLHEKPREEKPREEKPRQEKPQEKSTQKSATKPQKQANLDLNLPSPNSAAAPSLSGRRPSFSRPAGITRSGENDEFGRGVLKSMQRAMSTIRAPISVIVLRTLLDENGNVKSVELIEGDAKASFTQELIFAIRTATYPFPPRPSTIADRTFEVLYRYR